MEQIHLSVDGARIGRAEERATCTVCEKELQDGENIAVHIHFNEYWRINWKFCIDCLDGMLDLKVLLDELEGELHAEKDIILPLNVDG